MKNRFQSIVSRWSRSLFELNMSLSVQFDITNACNLSCEHCYHPHHHNSGGLTYEQWLQIFDQYHALREELGMLPNIAICGGEPLLCPFLIPFLEKIRGTYPNCPLDILTNGVLITNEIAKIFKALNISVQISFEGASSLDHDRIRGMGNFDLAMRGVELLKKEKTDFYFQTVLSEKTSPWIDDFFAMAKKCGASSMDFTRLIVEGHATNLISKKMDSPLLGFPLRDAMRKILEASRKYDLKTCTTGPLWCLIDEKLGSMSDVGLNAFVVDYQGHFKPASRIPLRFGNVLQDGMSHIFFKHPDMNRLRDGDIDLCRSCSYENQCRGNRCASYTKYGHLFGVDPACWVQENVL